MTMRNGWGCISGADTVGKVIKQRGQRFRPNHHQKENEFRFNSPRLNGCVGSTRRLHRGASHGNPHPAHEEGAARALL